MVKCIFNTIKSVKDCLWEYLKTVNVFTVLNIVVNIRTLWTTLQCDKRHWCWQIGLNVPAHYSKTYMLRYSLLSRMITVAKLHDMEEPLLKTLLFKLAHNQNLNQWLFVCQTVRWTGFVCLENKIKWGPQAQHVPGLKLDVGGIKTKWSYDLVMICYMWTTSTFPHPLLPLVSHYH